MCWQEDKSGQLGFSTSVYCPTRVISVLATAAKRDQFESLQRSLLIANIMVSGGTVCPQGISNTRLIAILAWMKVSGREHTTSGQNHRHSSGQAPAAFASTGLPTLMVAVGPQPRPSCDATELAERGRHWIGHRPYPSRGLLGHTIRLGLAQSTKSCCTEIGGYWGSQVVQALSSTVEVVGAEGQG